jgi:hypothetical protein
MADTNGHEGFPLPREGSQAEVTPAVTTEALQRDMEALRQRVEQAQAQKKADIDKKVGERESLIAEARRNDELLKQATEALDYFTSMKEAGVLQEQQDKDKLEELEALVGSLETNRNTIDANIASRSVGDVLGNIQDAAKKEDAEHTLKALIEETHRELDPQIDELAEAVKELAAEAGPDYERGRRLESERWNARREVEELLNRASNMASGTGMSGLIDSDWQASKTLEEFTTKLSERRKALGWFSGKEKAAIDFVLGSNRELKRYYDAKRIDDELNGRTKKRGVDEAALFDRYDQIVTKSWEVNDKIEELTGNRNSLNNIGWDLSFRLKRQLEVAAGVKLANGKDGESWHGAMNNGTDEKKARNRALYQFYGDRNAMFNDPRAEKQ